MKHTSERKSIFKKGKGRAFLKFLLGELTLFAIVSICFLFIVQGDVSLLLPESVLHPSVGAMKTQAAPTDTPAPTPVATLAPTTAPTLAPTATPIPFEMLSMSLGEAAPEAPTKPNDQLKLGMSECRAFTDAGQNVLIVSGHAYIEGRDAAKSDIYLLVIDAGNASVVGTYPAVSAPETAMLTFPVNSGSNLSNAFFTARIDVAEYYNGSFMISALVVNEDKAARNDFDTRTFHFRVENGALIVVE